MKQLNDKLLKLSVGASLAMATVFGWVGIAGAVTPTPEQLATDSGTAFRDTGIAIIAVLIPLAVALLLAKKALPWARRMLHV